MALPCGAGSDRDDRSGGLNADLICCGHAESPGLVWRA